MGVGIEVGDDGAFSLVPDLALSPDPMREGAFIAHSLAQDSYLFLDADKAEPLMMAIEGLKQGKDWKAIQDELAAASWDLDVRAFQRMLFSRRLGLFSGELHRPGKADARFVKGSDETFAMSKALLRIEPKGEGMGAGKARALRAFFKLSSIAMAVAWIAAIIIDEGARDRVALAGILEGRGAWNAVGIFIPAMILVGLLSFGLHEMGHVLAAIGHGLRLRSVQWRIYRGYQGMLLVQIPGIPLLPPKAQFSIALAGPLLNLWQGLAYGCLLIFHVGGTPFEGLWTTAAAGNLMMALGNLNPFFPTDGYKMISLTLFGDPDIKSRVIARFRAGGFKRLEPKERLYIIFYFVSIGLICVLGVMMVTKLSELIEPLAGSVPMWIARAAGWMGILWLQIRSVAKFLKGSKNGASVRA
jgi:Zn-dependent protease